MTADGVLGIDLPLPTVPDVPLPTLPELPPIVTDPPPIVTDPPPIVTDPPPIVTDPPPIITDPPPIITDPPPIVTDPPLGTSSPPTQTSNPPSTSTPRRPPSTDSTSSTTEPSAAEPPRDVDESSIPDSELAPGAETTSPLPDEVAVSELDIVAAAARLEALAVEAYTIAREAATTGSFGPVPPAIVNYLDTAHGHHRVALETWNRVLAAAGEPTVVEAPADPVTAVAGQFAAAIDGAGAARVVLGIERTAAATYLNALGELVSEPAIRLAGSMLSIDQQHISWLLFASGEYPVPETFASAQLAGTDA